MGNSNESLRKAGTIPFREESNDGRYWQRVYATAVVIAQTLQDNAVDPDEYPNFTSGHIHSVFMSQRIFTFDEDLIFKVAISLLKERHIYTYNYKEGVSS